MPRRPFWHGVCKAANWEHNLSDKISNEQIEVEDIQIALEDLDFAGDDAVVPFQVEGLDVRGRAVQWATALTLF